MVPGGVSARPLARVAREPGTAHAPDGALETKAPRVMRNPLDLADRRTSGPGRRLIAHAGDAGLRFGMSAVRRVTAFGDDARRGGRASAG